MKTSISSSFKKRRKKMKTIYNLSEINYQAQDSIEFEATIVEVMNEGQESTKRPMRVSFKLENSGEIIQGVSWNFEILQILKDGVKSIDVFQIEALAGIFKDTEQIRFGNIKNLNKPSTRKVITILDINSLKREYTAILNQYIRTPIIRGLLDELVMNDSRFFEWPAAKSIHHNYEGGLAVHTLSVTNLAIASWENYHGQNIDIEVIIAGAMLHDIGKISEYTKDGEKTTFGFLISHLVEGTERVNDFCYRKGINANTDKKILLIKHIILSHHEKLEFGSPVTPACLEAIIVARADNLDATFEGISKELENYSVGTISDKLAAADGGRMLKWK
jgi:3'-5' exoribonuclease